MFKIFQSVHLSIRLAVRPSSQRYCDPASFVLSENSLPPHDICVLSMITEHTSYSHQSIGEAPAVNNEDRQLKEILQLDEKNGTREW